MANINLSNLFFFINFSSTSNNRTQGYGSYDLFCIIIASYHDYTVLMIFCQENALRSQNYAEPTRYSGHFTEHKRTVPLCSR